MAEDTRKNNRRLKDVHKRALDRFDEASQGQLEVRAHALECRRFISIPGAMWEGPWGEQFENSIKVEVDKLTKGVDKIVTDYRENRIVPDFRPAGGNSDTDTANTLDGMHRADSYHFKAQQARDNAFEEAAAGGMGAYRLANELADPSDKENEEQRINPGLIIVDADQRVFFDPNAKTYDKSDARYCFVLTADIKSAFEEDYPDGASDWPDPTLRPQFDWFAPDAVIKAEYYEVTTKADTLIIATQTLSGEQDRFWQDEVEASDLKDLRAQGWKIERKKRDRRIVTKYLMTGAEVLEETRVAGDQIPVVPVYGKRWFVENQERFRGYVSKRMDAQRIYNGRVSKLAETDSLAPREKPIFAASQMPPHLANLWSEQEQSRHPYALVDPLIDPVTGQIVATGAIGKIEPPQLAPVTATLLQIASGDLTEETQDGAEKVVANTSAEAMDIAATRVDAKSGIFLDNMRQSVQREGEIYLAMAKEVYWEPGRTVETMTEDGDDGEALLHEPYTDPKTGSFRIRNDFERGKYKVIADVTEATSTRRDKTVKQMLTAAEVMIGAQDIEGAQAAIMTATLNMDGEGLDDFIRFQRRRALALGLVEANEEEKAAMEAQAQAEAQAPDPAANLAEAQSNALNASAAKDAATAKKTEVDAALSEAKIEQVQADTLKKEAEARDIARNPSEPPQDGQPNAFQRFRNLFTGRRGS